MEFGGALRRTEVKHPAREVQEGMTNATDTNPEAEQEAEAPQHEEKTNATIPGTTPGITTNARSRTPKPKAKTNARDTNTRGTTAKMEKKTKAANGPRGNHEQSTQRGKTEQEARPRLAACKQQLRPAERGASQPQTSSNTTSWTRKWSADWRHAPNRWYGRSSPSSPLGRT